MKWLLSLFSRRNPPSMREIPGLLLKAAVLGVLTGPICGVGLTAIFTPAALAELFGNPISSLLGTMAIGVVFSVCFYVASGLGNSYLRLYVAGFPASITSAIYVLYNILASLLAFSTAALILTRVNWGIFHIEMPWFWQAFAVEGILGGVLALVIGAFVKLKVQVQHTQARLGEKEIETARAQALALQSQINPHFFFNTLNSISALVDDDPLSAKRMIGRLADMFRYTLGCTHTESVGLEQEVQFVRDYLDIEQARFRKRLTVELPASPVPDVRVPGLVLQPLVENAVKHGIASLVEGGTVSVRVTQSAGASQVYVRNTPGDRKIEPQSCFRAGHALENVRARLRLFTGVPEPLRISCNSEWTEFSFEIRADK